MIPIFAYCLRNVNVVVPENVKLVVLRLYMNIKTTINISVKVVVKKFINIAMKSSFNHPIYFRVLLMILVALKYLVSVVRSTTVLQFTENSISDH